MIKEDKIEIERLLSLTTATYGDKDSCKRMIQKYISSGYTFCMTCDPQVLNAFKKLRQWWQSQTTPYQFIKTLN
jgi:hypothetical protein